MTQLSHAEKQPAHLRDQIAEALMSWAERNNAPQYAAVRRPDTVRQNAYGRADAVLAVLEAAGIRDADRQAAGQPAACGCGDTATPNVIHRPGAPCYIDEAATEEPTEQDTRPASSDARANLLREMTHDHLYMTDERANELLDAYRAEVLAQHRAEFTMADARGIARQHRANVLREAAEVYEDDGHLMARFFGHQVAARLRRMADEAAQ